MDIQTKLMLLAALLILMNKHFIEAKKGLSSTRTALKTTTTTELNPIPFSARLERNSNFFPNGNSTAGSSKSSSTIDLDQFGTLHIQAPNQSVPVTINGIQLFQAMQSLFECIQTPCPPQYYRTGCEAIPSSGNCVPCPPCPDQSFRSGCGGASEGECLVKTGCDANEFEVRSSKSVSDLYCVPLTTCASNELEQRAPTKTTDRLCAVKYKPSSGMPCSKITNFILDCADPSSRTTITVNHICEVARVDNCCCKEFSSLTFVSGDINISGDETILHFGTIQEVRGSIYGGGPSLSHPGPLQMIDFGQVTVVGESVSLSRNEISKVDFNSLAQVNGSLWLAHNSLESINFRSITRIGSSLWLENNPFTHIDFGAIHHIGGWLSLFNNALTSIDFGAVKYIGHHLWVYNNELDSLDLTSISYIGGAVRVDKNEFTSINCHNLGSCLCRSEHMTDTNCHGKCEGFYWSGDCA